LQRTALWQKTLWGNPQATPLPAQTMLLPTPAPRVAFGQLFSTGTEKEPEKISEKANELPPASMPVRDFLMTEMTSKGPRLWRWHTAAPILPVPQERIAGLYAAPAGPTLLLKSVPMQQWLSEKSAERSLALRLAEWWLEKSPKAGTPVKTDR
jgi:hypothetical protein